MFCNLKLLRRCKSPFRVFGVFRGPKILIPGTNGMSPTLPALLNGR